MLLTTNLFFLNYCIIFTYTFQQLVTTSCSLTNVAPSRQHPVENSNPSFQLLDLTFFHGHSPPLFPSRPQHFFQLCSRVESLVFSVSISGFCCFCMDSPLEDQQQLIEPSLADILHVMHSVDTNLNVFILSQRHKGPEVCQKSVILSPPQNTL